MIIDRKHVLARLFPGIATLQSFLIKSTPEYVSAPTGSESKSSVNLIRKVKFCDVLIKENDDEDYKNLLSNSFVATLQNSVLKDNNNTNNADLPNLPANFTLDQGSSLH